MAAKIVRMALGTLIVGLFFLAAPGAFAQEEAPSPVRVREALRQGIELNKKGDYEKAAPFFLFAKTGEQALTPPEKKDLADFNAKNALDMKAREDGTAQLAQADLALKTGRTREAGQILGALKANQALTALQRQQVDELSRKLPADANAKAPPKDAKALMAAGREALKVGDFDRAEMLADQAEKASSITWFPAWNDTPAKLRRDIQVARAKMQAPPEPKQADKAPPPWWSLDRVFGKSDNPPPPPKKDGPSASENRVDAMMARQMVSDGFRFLSEGDAGKAHFVAMKAKELNVAWGPNEQTPDILLAAIQAQSGVAAPPPPTPIQPVAAVKPAQAPDAAKPKPIVLDPKADPRLLLKQGRDALAQHNFEIADKACSLALAAKASWGFWEDTPDKLRRDLIHAHQTADRDESVRLMVEARRSFTAGNLDEAEKKAYTAQKLHGPYGVFDFGERPARLLDEVRQARLTQAKERPTVTQTAKADPAMATKPAPAGVPASVQNADKNRAIVMVREAREMERLGMLTQARQKALEARGLKAPFLPDEDSPDNVLQSLTARADRDIQSHMQLSVALAHDVNDRDRFRKAAAEITLARNIATDFGLDLSRIDVAFAQLQQVEKGTQPVSALAAQPNPSDPFRADPRVEQPSGDPQKDQMRKLAREKLLFAQRELSAGKCDTAARLAEELCKAEYGVREEAMRLLRSINAEEYNQRILESKRTFESGLDCVARKDFRKAMYLFQAIDLMYLPAEYQARMRDVMAMREMQPQAPEQQYQAPSYLKAVAIQEKGPATPRGANPDPNDDLLATTKAMEKVQYEALRQRGYEALKSAHEKFKAGQKQDAIGTLEAYCENVNRAQLSEKARTTELLRPAELRIQQYKTLMADAALARAGSSKVMYSVHDENKREREIQKQQKEVADLVKEGAELYKQGKYKESEEIGRKVLAIDPENPAAVVLIMTSHNMRRQKEYDSDTHHNDEGLIDLLKHNTMPLYMSDPDKNPVAFDPDRQRRTPGDGTIVHDLKDPKERAIEYRLKQPISLNFKDTPLRDAIRDLSILSGVQVVPDMRALQEAKVNLDAPLSGAADNINMKNALNILLKPMRLTYIIEDQVLKITTEDRTIGRLVRITYPIADLIVPVEDHPLPDVYDITKVLQRCDWLVNIALTQGYLGMGVSPFPMSPGMPAGTASHGLGSSFGSQNGQPGSGPPKPRTKHEVAEELKALIQNTIAKNSWEDMGGTGSIQYFPMGLALVITQPQEVQEEVQLLLATLRKLQDLQVAVELRAVLVSETFFERIGVDFNMNIQTPISRTEPNLLNNTFVQAPFLNRVGSGLNMISGLTSAGTLTPDLNIPINNGSFALTQPQFGGYQPTAGLQLGLAFLSDIQVFMFLEAVQGDRRAHIMQAPKITVYNGQTATITGTMVRPEIMGMVPNQMSNGALFMSPITVGVPFGLSMTVQPVVSPDRRFIRLNVTPTLVGQAVNDPAAAIVQTVPQAIPTTLDGGILVPPLANNTQGVIIQPQQANVFIAQTTVNVPDGGTVLLGGFKFLAEERTEYGPPVLSNIPYLSRLFRNVGWSRDGSTLIYLVTARVIMVEEEENIFLGNIPPIPGR